MTHDELLEIINKEIKVCASECNKHVWDNAPWKALSAVVELHKPVHVVLGMEITTCGGCSSVMLWERCPTIQAIEKDLL